MSFWFCDLIAEDTYIITEDTYIRNPLAVIYIALHNISIKYSVSSFTILGETFEYFFDYNLSMCGLYPFTKWKKDKNYYLKWLIGIITSVFVAIVGFIIKWFVLYKTGFDLWNLNDNILYSLSYVSGLGVLRYVIKEWLQANVFLPMNIGDDNNPPTPASAPAPAGGQGNNPPTPASAPAPAPAGGQGNPGIRGDGGPISEFTTNKYSESYINSYKEMEKLRKTMWEVVNSIRYYDDIVKEIELGEKLDSKLPDPAKASNSHINYIKGEYPSFFDNDTSVKENLEDVKSYVDEELASYKSQRNKLNSKIKDLAMKAFPKNTTKRDGSD